DDLPASFPTKLKYPELPVFVWETTDSKDTLEDYDGLFEAMTHQLELIQGRILSHVELQMTIHKAGACDIFNCKVWLSLPEFIRNVILSHKTETEIYKASYDDFRTWISQAVAFLEFRNIIASYLKRRPQGNDSLSRWHSSIRQLSA
ncbi:MAG: hypothetical protein ACK56I_31745, partial [bacterium]